MRSPFLVFVLLGFCVCLLRAQPGPGSSPDYDVRAFGARGDGVTRDSDAINRAIEAASAAGGGTVRFPAGNYLCFSIRLKSRITLRFDAGAVLTAAVPSPGFGAYDPPEPNVWGDEHEYQDFGHSHWRNSLLWGENLENVTLEGPGLIDGSKGLVRGGRRGAPMNGLGNKALALKLCRNVVVRDLSFLLCGHFAVLATGVDNLTIDNVKVDSNRDGFDIDACRNVRISNCSVNTPNDDAIVLKSSYALGFARPTENVTIVNCQVTGFDAGSFLDGSFRRAQAKAPDQDGPTGRIKCGTESNGGFRNITISNCVFERSRGLALETVDGGPLEDVAISNIVMREVSNSPIFLRLGNRARGPKDTPVAVTRRISISHVIATDVDPRYPILIAGLPGHPIEDLRLSDIRVYSRGGLDLDLVARQPEEHANAFFQRHAHTPDKAPEKIPFAPRDPFSIPEQVAGYPEPSMFGLLPASGLLVRHASDLAVDGLDIRFAKEDKRPVIYLEDVSDLRLSGLRADKGGASLLEARNVSKISLQNCEGLPSFFKEHSDSESL